MTDQALPKPQPKDYFSLGIFVVAIFGVGSFIGATSGSGPGIWYDTLNKPIIQPPNAAFGIVWPILYVMIAVAAWRIWQRPSSPLRSTALTLFAVQLGFNFAWSPIFFTLHQIGLAAIWIAIMVVLAVWAARRFYKLDRLAAALMLPYLVWISFASVLNGWTWVLNH
ncbi:MAG: TspO/MBR family protein [Pseudomonadota bacterium]